MYIFSDGMNLYPSKDKEKRDHARLLLIVCYDMFSILLRSSVDTTLLINKQYFTLKDLVVFCSQKLGNFKPRANGRNIVGEQLPTLLDVTLFLPFAYSVTCCWELLCKVWNRSNVELRATDSTTPNIGGPTMLTIVASVCTPLPTHTQQLPTLLAQQCRESLLRPFARSFNPNGDGVKLSRFMENLNTRQRFPFSLFVNLDTVL